MPIGSLEIIPSFEFLSLNHKEIKLYRANASLTRDPHFIIYSLNYPELKRTLTIKSSKDFPYTIESWEESFHQKGKKRTSKAVKIKTILSAYWSKNGVTDISERKELGL